MGIEGNQTNSFGHTSQLEINLLKLKKKSTAIPIS